MPLSPQVKVTIRGEGSVVWHDETRYGLRRLCVMSREKYPDADVWLGLLPKNADVRTARYTEKETSGIWQYYLWLYWKEHHEKSNQ